MGPPRSTFREHPSRALLPTRATSPTRRPVGRAILAQDSVVPLGRGQQQLQRQVLDDVRLPHLLDGIKRPGAQRAVCAPHQEPRRERPHRPAQWTHLRPPAPVRIERKGRPARWSG